jgi:5'-3' exonuclease|tara:strand:+ start:114 stop:941 length:828 start_codon:yes stop_codon:yes gene_type:complete
MVQINGKNAETLSEDLVRHMVLNSLRAHNKKFRKEYGEMVIACDSGNVWRKQIFPNYKAGRKANREKSEHDWDAIFNMLATIKNEIKTFMPYKVIEVESCEADDIIATLIKKVKNMIIPEHKKKILILSGDKDFIQLHGPNVRQYNPVLNKFVGKGEDPVIYIREHILKGDRSDGIPNVLSDDNVFIEGRRQKPLSKKKLNNWVNDVFFYTNFTEEEEKNYNRNRKLIDLSSIPQEIEDKINNEFNDVKVASRDKILGYFINKKLKTLIEVIDEF